MSSQFDHFVNRIREALRSILQRARSRALVPELVAHSSVKKLARTLMTVPAVHEHLRATPHFGVVRPPNRLDISRLDYVELQCRLLLELKEAYPGSGLSRKRTIGNAQPTGLEICQVWAILGSYGHLWGTFATERALIFQMYHQDQIGEFLALFPNSEKTVIAKQGAHLSIYHLHECLALLRLENLNLAAEELQVLRSLWSLYISRSPEVSELLRVFRFVRKVAIAELHNRAGISAVGEIAPQLVGTSNSARSTAGAVHPAIARFIDRPGLRIYRDATAFERLLDAVARYEYETFFSSADTASAVLAHLREFKRWWKARSGDLKPSLMALFRRPAGWASDSPDDLAQFVRMPMTVKPREWPADVRAWWVDGSPWAGANFYLTLLPGSSAALLDVFVAAGSEELPARTLAHILNMREAWGFGRPGRPGDNVRRRREEAAASLLVACVNARLKRAYRLELEPADRAPMARVYRWSPQGRKQIEADIRKTGDEARRKELRLFLNALQAGRPRWAEGECVLWLNGRGSVVDQDDATQTDFDGCLVRASDSEWSILVCECKHKSRRARIGKQVERWGELFARPVHVGERDGPGGKAGTIVIAAVAGK